ncbi:MAG: hypothetical protein ACI8S7_002174, partial [Candidatus Krumholzibacteriia bacterium]
MCYNFDSMPDFTNLSETNDARRPSQNVISRCEPFDLVWRAPTI